MKTRWFDLAARAATYSPHKDYKMGAVLLNKNRVISFGCNNPRKTHTLCRNPDKFVHAEFDTIIGVPKHQLEDATIYVVRLGRGGEYRCSKPCEHCESILVDAGLKDVYYINNKDEYDHMYLEAQDG